VRPDRLDPRVRPAPARVPGVAPDRCAGIQAARATL